MNKIIKILKNKHTVFTRKFLNFRKKRETKVKVELEKQDINCNVSSLLMKKKTIAG